MAIDANSLTLAQYAMQSNDPLIRMIVNSLYTFDSVLKEIPIITKSTLKINGARMVGSLPTVNWRKINDPAIATSGTVQQFTENVHLIGNTIDIDKAMLKDENAIQDPRVVQLQMWLESMTYDINDKFINNGPLTGDPNAPLGIRYRLDNPSAFDIPTACKINGGGVDMSSSGLTATTAGNFFELLDQALQEVGSPDGVNCHIYLNRLLTRRMNLGIKRMGAGGGFDMARDAFDRVTYFYRGAMIHTVGVKADQTTEIITSTETAAGADGASTFSSFYVVHAGVDRFTPWQMAPLAASSFDNPAQPTQNRTYVDWSLGFLQSHNRALARVYNVKVS